ncbi:LOW QUALITY PROTEIN: mitochondrial enolase superfamily member 1 [Xenentodon cancila]
MEWGSSVDLFTRLLTGDGQMRWLGPEKGVTHLATAAVLNAVWDLALAEGKPLWKLLVDRDPEQIVSCIDFRSITEVLAEDEALDMLVKAQQGKRQRCINWFDRFYFCWLRCHNRVMFKLLQASARQFVQINSCRLCCRRPTSSPVKV